jgi:predicted O-methyltransferase YrrM
VEFGTSFGISTMYLAAAVTDNGTGRVVTTELSERKIRTAGPIWSRVASARR